MRQFLIGSLLLLFAVCASAAPPAIVLITIDNAGYGDIGCYGNPVVRTPHIDRLAYDGVRCTDFYIVTSACSPSRASLLTGRYPLRNGLTVQVGVEDNRSGIGLRHSEKLIPQYLKQAGYRTACIGKWNIGFAEGSRPTDRGFDEFFGFRSGNIDYYDHVYAGEKDMFRNTEPVDIEGYSTDLFADAACDFIRRNANRPFFAYVAFNAPHYPSARNKAPGAPCIWQAPAKYFELYGFSPDSHDWREGYLAVVSALDAGIGRIIQQVDALGLRENTIILVISDNGSAPIPIIPRLAIEVGSNAPFRSGRTTLYEGAIRTPCVIRWPARLKPGTVCHQPICNLDILPMLVKSVGLTLPKDRVLDGHDPTETLKGTSPSRHEYLFFEYKKCSAVRSGRWKIVRLRPEQPFELYDLLTDIGETRNVAEKEPETLSRLSQAFEAWRAEFRADQATP
jgi:arylsulfatase A